MTITTRRRRLAAAAVAGTALAAVGVVGTTALFTADDQIDNNEFAFGTVSIDASPATAVVGFSNMAPGDQVTAPITITNDGSLEMRYAMSSVTTDDDAASALVMTIKSGVTTCTDAGFDIDGTVLYSGPLGSTSELKVLGDKATGQDPGDRVLAAGASEELCVNVTLPLSTGNALQGKQTTATFIFNAEQTKNN